MCSYKSIFDVGLEGYTTKGFPFHFAFQPDVVSSILLVSFRSRNPYSPDLIMYIKFARYVLHLLQKSHSYDRPESCVQAGTTGLDGLDLCLGPREPAESSRKLRAIPELSLLRLDPAKGRAGGAANMPANNCREVHRLIQGAVLLCLLSVGSKGLGQLMGWGGWVRMWSVVDLCDAC